MLQVTIRLTNTINDTLELRRDDESLAAKGNPNGQISPAECLNCLK
jgi:hypothetical protein